jgi:hypothetical protein
MTLQHLGLKERNDPLTEIIAVKIIELAQTGERDPVRMRELVLQSVQGQMEP